MKIIKKINKIRHIVPDKYKVYVYMIIGLLCAYIGSICEENNITGLSTYLSIVAIICIFLEYYFAIKTTIVDFKESKRMSNKIKCTLILAKLKAGIPLEPFEIKIVYKIIKRNRKDVLQKLKKEDSKFKQK